MEKGAFITYANNLTTGEEKYFNVPQDFSDFMQGTEPGQTVQFTYYTYSTETKDFSGPVVEDIVLDSNGSVGFLGVSSTISGISFITPDAMVQTGINPFYGKETLQECAMGVLSFISMPFKGFSPVPESVTWWYDSNTIPDELFWILIWTIYWIFWLDIVLGISNALPALPFDGGLLLVGTLDWIYEKAGVKEEKAREQYVGATANVISYSMLGILILVLIAVII